MVLTLRLTDFRSHELAAVELGVYGLGDVPIAPCGPHDVLVLLVRIWHLPLGGGCRDKGRKEEMESGGERGCSEARITPMDRRRSKAVGRGGGGRIACSPRA